MTSSCRKSFESGDERITRIVLYQFKMYRPSAETKENRYICLHRALTASSFHDSNSKRANVIYAGVLKGIRRSDFFSGNIAPQLSMKSSRVSNIGDASTYNTFYGNSSFYHPISFQMNIVNKKIDKRFFRWKNKREFLTIIEQWMLQTASYTKKSLVDEWVELSDLSIGSTLSWARFAE